MPKLYSINPDARRQPQQKPSEPAPVAAPGPAPAPVEAGGGIPRDPGRDALGKFLKGHHMGRPKGGRDKRPRRKIGDIAYELTFGNDDYLDTLQIRLLYGDVPAKVETDLWAHTYGKPPKRAEVQDNERKPLIIAMRKPMDYDPLAGKLAERQAKAAEKPVVVDAASQPILVNGIREEDLPGPGEGQGTSEGMETVDLP
jgi:hypothetical protein